MFLFKELHHLIWYKFSLLTYIILKISEDILFFFRFWRKLHQLFDFGLRGINFEINLTVNYTHNIFYIKE
jgi:hypothetical protein